MCVSARCSEQSTSPTKHEMFDLLGRDLTTYNIRTYTRNILYCICFRDGRLWGDGVCVCIMVHGELRDARVFVAHAVLIEKCLSNQPACALVCKVGYAIVSYVADVFSRVCVRV